MISISSIAAAQKEEENVSFFAWLKFALLWAKIDCMPHHPFEASNLLSKFKNNYKSTLRGPSSVLQHI
jgi:hypothetical protein